MPKEPFRGISIFSKKVVRFFEKSGLLVMITLSTAYAAHFHDMFIDGKDNAKRTGDRMKMLMLTLPFMVRDLITPEVH